MNAARTHGWLIAILLAAGTLGLRAPDLAAQPANPTPSPAVSSPKGSEPRTVSAGGVSERGPRREGDVNPLVKAADDGRKAQIKAIDEKIKSLRDQFKAQAD